jgi:UDP-N-acetylmuramoylalanine--D-glutamate ligase
MTTTGDNWNELPVTIVGMGRSAVGAAALLQKHGARPMVTDAADGPELDRWRAELDRLGIPCEVGGHSEGAWRRADLVVLSPGVPPARIPADELAERGVEVIGELELASRFSQAPILAVTGTNGKTTVTELLHFLLTRCGCRSRLAGNNHTSFSAALCDDSGPEYYVLEVSSYQLETVATFSPWIGAVLNLTPDHLGRHGSMANYGLAKTRVFGSAARGADYAVLNGDDPQVSSMQTPADARRVTFSLCQAMPSGLFSDGNQLWIDGELRGDLSFPLPGTHNRANVLAALAMLHAGGFDLDRCLEALPDFPGVVHRLEPLGCSSDRLWYNDSKSTNLDSLRVALESFGEPVVLIAGGQGKKGSSYKTLKSLVSSNVSHLVAYGAEGPLLGRTFEAVVPVSVVPDLPRAVDSAFSHSDSGDTVLLSPGCASFDQYSDFEARGEHFRALVGALDNEEVLP